jgi:hypothetical protein
MNDRVTAAGLDSIHIWDEMITVGASFARDLVSKRQKGMIAIDLEK